MYSKVQVYRTGYLSPDTGPDLAAELIIIILTRAAQLIRVVATVIEAVALSSLSYAPIVGTPEVAHLKLPPVSTCAPEEARRAVSERAVALRLVRPVTTVRDPVTRELQGHAVLTLLAADH